MDSETSLVSGEGPTNLRRGLDQFEYWTSVMADLLNEHRTLTPRATMSAMRAAQQWHPAKYLAFERYRLRPALELLARVPVLPSENSTNDATTRIVDLGAGTCNMAPAFLQRWPRAHVTFVDTSASMLERGKADHHADSSFDASRLSYVEASFDSFEPSDPVDLIYANAAIHWVSSELHKTLIPKLFSFLKPGGVLAFQIPDTRAQPSHQLMVEAGKQLGWERDIAGVRWVTCDQEPSFYYEILEQLIPGSEIMTNVDMWSTTYAQVMEGENPVADFTSSTGLGPYLEALGGRGSPRAIQFEEKYRELTAQAYTKQKDGRTIFNLKRFFVVATKPVAV